jgi:uncharacterized protein
MTQRPTADPDVVDNADANRYEIRVGSALAGVAVYHSEGDGRRIAFPHTEVQSAFRGRGLGSRLVRAALDDAGDRGLIVVPICPFVADWVRLHPEYIRLVDEDHRSAVEAKA